MPDAFVGFLILATGFLLFISVAIAFSDGSRAAAGCSLLFLILVTMLSTWFFTAARQPLEITGEGWWDIETITFKDGTKQQLYDDGSKHYITATYGQLFPDSCKVHRVYQKQTYYGICFSSRTQAQVESVCSKEEFEKLKK
jgi:hypothetical protein